MSAVFREIQQIVKHVQRWRRKIQRIGMPCRPIRSGCFMKAMGCQQRHENQYVFQPLVKANGRNRTPSRPAVNFKHPIHSWISGRGAWSM